MSWLYNGHELADDDIPDKSIGFIYLITNSKTGRKYLGRKLLTKAHTRQKNKKIIRSRIDSDWRDYWSSSPELLAEIAENGAGGYVREILMFVPMKGQLLYVEECLQYVMGVLESDGWYNSNLRAKIFRRNVIGKPFVEEMRSVINNLQKKDS